MELARLLWLVRRWWWLLALGVLIGGGSAYAVSQFITPIYRTSATLLVNQTQTPGVIAYNDILTSERLTRTYKELITKRPVLEDAVDSLALDLDAGALASAVDVDVVGDTQLLRLSVEDPVPIRARLLANALASAFIRANEGVQLSRTGSVSIVESAETPVAPVWPQTTLNTLMGALVGLLLAGAFALLYEYLDDTIKTADDIEAVAKLPTLGRVARFPRIRTPADGLAFAGDRTTMAEAYRVLRTNLQFSTFEVRTLLVCSGTPREGKTTTAANLATAIAQTGQRTIVVDSDMRRPTLHKIFGLSNGAGLTNALMSQEPDPIRFLQPTSFENLSVLTSGPQPPNPSELLSSERMDAVIDALRNAADVVLFDSPPLLAVADGSVLAAKVDGAVLVVDAGRTRAPALRQAAETLARAKAKMLGAILNKLTTRGHEYYGYYGYSYYQSTPEDQTNGHRKWRFPWNKEVPASQENKTHV